MRGLINGEIEVRRFPRASSSRGRASNVAARFWLKQIWSGEHHFFWDGRRSDRLSCSLRRQDNEYSALGIGAGVVSAIYHHPFTLLSAWYNSIT